MDSSTVRASIVATLCATLALASAQVMAAKPGGGGSTDPCATSATTTLDFPAFAFWKPSGKTQQIYVADSTGKCIRFVANIKSGSGGGGTLQFSLLDSDKTKGRVVWVEAPDVVGVDFTVATDTNQISVSPKATLYSGTGGGISLSKDGHTLYSTRFLNTGEIVIDKRALDPLGLITTVFQTATTNEYIDTISVSGDGMVLYADYKPSAGVSPVYQLVYVLLPGGSITASSVLDSNGNYRQPNPAVDQSSLSYRVAYQRAATTAGGCDLLVTSSSLDPFTIEYPLRQPTYGMKPTWLNGKILADGRVASTRNGCDYTGKIMQTDPATGEQIALTSGYDPDGR